MNLIAASTQDIFGTIKPPVSTIPNDPTVAVGSLISAGIQIFILVAAFALLIYLLLGAFEWIVSGGEKEKLTKAQLKITNAVVGIVIIILVISVFCIVTVNILNLSPDGKCFTFTIPTL